MRSVLVILCAVFVTALLVVSAYESAARPDMAVSLRTAVHQDEFCQAPGVENSYDNIFKAAVKTYNPPRFNTNTEWCWSKSQAMVESGINPDAVSPAGAMGVMQLMPSTFEEITSRYGVQPDETDIRLNIQMGVAYQSAMYKSLYDSRTKDCHRATGHAVYNCGLGCFIDAQVKAGGAMCLDKITPYLPQETQVYHPKIVDVHTKLTVY